MQIEKKNITKLDVRLHIEFIFAIRCSIAFLCVYQFHFEDANFDVCYSGMFCQFLVVCGKMKQIIYAIRSNRPQNEIIMQ